MSGLVRETFDYERTKLYLKKAHFRVQYAHSQTGQYPL